MFESNSNPFIRDINYLVSSILIEPTVFRPEMRDLQSIPSLLAS